MLKPYLLINILRKPWNPFTKASARHQKNYIDGLVDEQGRWQEDELKIEEVAVAYFDKLFTSSKPDDFSEILHAVQPKVTNAMNADLT